MDSSKSAPINLFGTLNADRAALLYVIGFAFLCLLSNAVAGFHQTHNDFWDTYFIARHITPTDSRTWFNPQYPIGTCLFLKIIMGHFPPEIPGIIANILFSTAILTASWLLYRKLMSGAVVFFTLIALSLFPRLFHYCTLAGGDPASMAFFAIGVLLIFKQLSLNGKQHPTLYLLGGAGLGIGALFRYHVLVGSAFLLIAWAIVYRHQWKYIFLSTIGLLIGYSPQFLINGLTGHGLLETQFGLMNVYDLMHGLSFYQTITLQLPPSVLSAIAQDPALFFRKYIMAFILLAPAYAPPLAAFFISKDRGKKRISLAVVLWTLLYCGFFAATTSGRSLLLPLSLSFLCAGMAAERVLEFLHEKISHPGYRAISTISVSLLLACFFIKDALFTYSRFQEHALCSEVESYLHDLGCTNVKQVFSTDFNIYFRTMPYYMPYFNGGCPRWGTYLYNDEYPEFPVGSLPAFFSECKKRGVRFVLLIRQCALLSPSLGVLYGNTGSLDGLVFKKEIGRFRIFEVERRL